MDPLRAENEQKDLIIAQLKAEAFDLRQKDRDYKALFETFINLQHKYNLLVDEKVSICYSFELLSLAI
jgi:hypothetical protein